MFFLSTTHYTVPARRNPQQCFNRVALRVQWCRRPGSLVVSGQGTASGDHAKLSEATNNIPISLGDQIVGCLRLENSRVVERALFLFKNESFISMLAENSQTFFLSLLSALLRGGEPFWNPTVTKASKGGALACLIAVVAFIDKKKKNMTHVYESGRPFFWVRGCSNALKASHARLLLT